MAKFWMTLCGTTLWLGLSFAWLGLTTADGNCRPRGHTASAAPTSAQRTAALINQLGDPQYAVRQQAQEELAKLGPEAFDVLVAAEENDDLEIAARARYLVHLIRIDWIHETDSPLVKEALTDYDSKNLRERRAVMLRLVEMPRSEALAPLCRLDSIREIGSRGQAGALAIMLQSEPAETAWPQQAKQILHALSGSDRAPARWLRNYVHSHDDPEAALADWDKLVTEELTVTDSTDPQAETQLQNLLLRNYAQMLLARHHRDRAFDVMRKMIARESDNVDELISFVDWLVEQKAWEVVDETARQFDRTFAADRTLLYAEAQSFKARGDEAARGKIRRAGVQDCFDGARGFDGPIPRWPSGFTRWEWSPGREKEYRRIIKDDPPDSNEGVDEPNVACRNVSRPRARRRSGGNVGKAGQAIE